MRTTKPTCAVRGVLPSYSCTGTCICSNLADDKESCTAEFFCEHQRKPDPTKTCLGCGAKQQPDGTLPCGH